MTRSKCPECGSLNTERVHVEWFAHTVEEVRICNECPTQYTNEFGDAMKRVDSTGEVA